MPSGKNTLCKGMRNSLPHNLVSKFICFGSTPGIRSQLPTPLSLLLTPCSLSPGGVDILLCKYATILFAYLCSSFPKQLRGVFFFVVHKTESLLVHVSRLNAVFPLAYIQHYHGRCMWSVIRKSRYDSYSFLA